MKTDEWSNFLQNRNADGNENAMKQTDETDNEKDNEENKEDEGNHIIDKDKYRQLSKNDYNVNDNIKNKTKSTTKLFDNTLQPNLRSIQFQLLREP